MTKLEREIVVDATPETIFGFLDSAEGITRWMGTDATMDARPGGAFRVNVAGQHPASGSIVEIVPNERIVMTWGWEGPEMPIAPGSTTVEISLHPEGGKTRVRLVHRDLPDENAVQQHAHGWDHYLGRLATVAGGGEVDADTGPA
jgi:uncharacterized protein YndB with AHSA1/START domain